MVVFFFFQAEDGIRDLVRSRGLGDVYKRQVWHTLGATVDFATGEQIDFRITNGATNVTTIYVPPTLSLIHI